jgi:hypothetical protein
MRTANYKNYDNQVRISEDSPMYMEPHERNHFEQVYKSTKEQLLCWGEESNYLDSEFSSTLERKDQGNL